MTARSFAPWANRKNRPDPGHDTREAVRQQLHDDIDTICDHWGNIADAANTEINLPGIASSEPGAERGGTSSMTDLDEHRNAYLKRVAATSWMRELEQGRAAVTRLAQLALKIDQPPAKAKKIEPEKCVKCDQEIDITAPDGKAHRVNGHALHANTCYHQVWRESVAEKVDMTIIVNLLADRIKR